MGISSSVEGGEDSEESESTMFAAIRVGVVVVGVEAAEGTTNGAPLGTYEVISISRAKVD